MSVKTLTMKMVFLHDHAWPYSRSNEPRSAHYTRFANDHFLLSTITLVIKNFDINNEKISYGRPLTPYVGIILALTTISTHFKG